MPELEFKVSHSHGGFRELVDCPHGKKKDFQSVYIYLCVYTCAYTHVCLFIYLFIHIVRQLYFPTSVS